MSDSAKSLSNKEKTSSDKDFAGHTPMMQQGLLRQICELF